MPTGFFGILQEGRAAEAGSWLCDSNPFPPPYQVSIVSTDVQTLQILCAGASYQLSAMVFDAQDATVVFSGSIYNRDDLVKVLECAVQVSDAELLHTAWDHWGDATPMHLNGDWMFAIYDKSEMALSLARSWGVSSLYYRHEGRSFAFSTNLRALIDLEGKRANPNLADVLLVLCAAGIPKPSESPYEEIVQLPPATILHFSNGKISVREFWRPHQEKRMPAVNEEHAYEHFAALYSSAVKSRIASFDNIGATLSAGLDSGSVCVLAADELGLTRKTLRAWTSIPRYPDEVYATSSWMSDERVLASNVVSSRSNIEHYLMDSSSSNPILSICRQETLTGRPQLSCANYYWMEDILSAAATQDCGAVLFGQFGNSTVSWSPHQIRFVPKHLFFPGTSWGKYLKYSKIKLWRYLYKIKKELSQKMRKPEEIFPLINPDLLHSDVFRQIQRSDSWQSPKKLGQAYLQELYMGTFDVLYQLSFQSGVEFRDPTMDIELTRFLLTLPENMYFRDGLDRRVMRLGMRGVLPDENRLNRKRGHQGADILPRIRENIGYAERALEYIGRSSKARDTINLPFMQSILDRLKNGETNASLMLDCTRYLLPGFSSGFFLADYDMKSHFEL